MEAEEIKTLRDRLGWSQEQLARELGVSFTTVNRWERGHASPSPLAERVLRRLAADSAADQVAVGAAR